jgi:hypothetical protein
MAQQAVQQPECIDQKFSLDQKNAHFSNTTAQYYKTENPDSGLKTGYTLKPRQDLCVLRFTEYCKRNGMLLIHNVGSGKTVTAAELVVNLYSWLTTTAINEENVRMDQENPELVRLNSDIDRVSVRYNAVVAERRRYRDGINTRIENAVNIATQKKLEKEMVDDPNNELIDQLQQQIISLQTQREAIYEPNVPREVLVITPTAMFGQFNEDIEKNVPGIHRDSAAGCADKVYTYRREVQDSRGRKIFTTSPSFTIKSMEYRDFNPIHAKYDEKVRDLKAIFRNKIVVFDEAHRLFRPFNPCDPNSTIIEKYITDNVLVEAKNVIFMTGTPIKNNVRDMFNMLRLLTMPNANNNDITVSEGFNLNNLITYEKFVPSHKLVFDLNYSITVSKTLTRIGWFFVNYIKSNYTDYHPDYCNLTTQFIKERKHQGLKEKFIECHNFLTPSRFWELLNQRGADLNIKQFKPVMKPPQRVGGNLKKTIRKNRKNRKNRTKKIIGGMTLTDSYRTLNITNEIPEAAENKKVEQNTESFDIVKTKYRELAKTIHPDKNPSPTANEEFIALNEAYKTITGEIPETFDVDENNEFPEFENMLQLYHTLLFTIDEGEKIYNLSKKIMELTETKEFQKSIEMIGIEHLLTEFFTTPIEIYTQYLKQSFINLQENADISILIENMKQVMNDTNITQFKNNIDSEKKESQDLLNYITSETPQAETTQSETTQAETSQDSNPETIFVPKDFDFDTNDVNKDYIDDEYINSANNEEEYRKNLSEQAEVDLHNIYMEIKTEDERETITNLLKEAISPNLEKIKTLQTEINEMQSSHGGGGEMHGGVNIFGMLTAAAGILGALTGSEPAPGANVPQVVPGANVPQVVPNINVPQVVPGANVYPVVPGANDQAWTAITPQFFTNIQSAANTFITAADQPIGKDLMSLEYNFADVRNSVSVTADLFGNQIYQVGNYIYSDPNFNSSVITSNIYNASQEAIDNVKELSKSLDQAIKGFDGSKVSKDFIDTLSASLEQGIGKIPISEVSQQLQNNLNEIKDGISKIPISEVSQQLQNKLNGISTSLSGISTSLSQSSQQAIDNVNKLSKSLDQAIKGFDGSKVSKEAIDKLSASLEQGISKIPVSEVSQQFKNNLNEIKDGISKIPISEVSQQFKDKISTSLSGISTSLSGMSTSLSQSSQQAIDNVNELSKSLKEAITSKASKETINKLSESLQQGISKIPISEVSQEVQNNFNKIKDAISNIPISGVSQEIQNKISTSLSGMSTSLSGISASLSGISPPLNGMSTSLSGISTSMGSFGTQVLTGFSEFSEDVVNVNQELTISERAINRMNELSESLANMFNDLFNKIGDYVKSTEIVKMLTEIMEEINDKFSELYSKLPSATLSVGIKLLYKAFTSLISTIVTWGRIYTCFKFFTQSLMLSYVIYTGRRSYKNNWDTNSIIKEDIENTLNKARVYLSSLNKKMLPNDAAKMKYAKKLGHSRLISVMNNKLAELNAFGSINIDAFVKDSQKIISTISTPMPQINEFYYNSSKNTNLYTIRKLYEENLLTIEGANLKYPERVIKNNYIFYSSYQVFLYNQMVFIKSFVNNRKNMQISNEFLPWFFNRPELLQKKFIGNCSLDIAYSQTQLKDSTKSIVYFDPSEGDYKINLDSSRMITDDIKKTDKTQINFECPKFNRILINLLLMKTGYMIYEKTDKNTSYESLYNENTSTIDLNNIEAYNVTIQKQPHFSKGKTFYTEPDANKPIEDIYKGVAKNSAHTIPDENPHSFLPFVYSCSDDLGLNLFAWYLKEKKFKYTNLHDIHPNYKSQSEKSLKETYPVIKIEQNNKAAFDKWVIDNVIKYSGKDISLVISEFRNIVGDEVYNRIFNDPICILLHPFKTEGVDGKYNPAIFLMEPPLNFCDYEQLCGRVLRSYNFPYSEKPRKMVYQMLTTSAECLDSFLRNNVGREASINSVLPEEQYFLKDYFAVETETPKQAGIFWTAKAKGIKLTRQDDDPVPSLEPIITRESISLPLYVPDYSLSLGYFDQLTSICKNAGNPTYITRFPEPRIEGLKRFLKFLYGEFGDITAYSDINENLLINFRSKLETSLQMYRRSKKYFNKMKDKVAPEKIAVTGFDYIRSDYSIIVRALENLYYSSILYQYTIFSLDLCYVFYKAVFKEEYEGAILVNPFNTSYLIKLMEYLDAIPKGDIYSSYEINLETNLKSMDFELNEMKEIKSTEYDFQKIIDKLSGLEEVKDYTPPVPNVKRIPDLDLILNCAGDDINSDNYFVASCDPMTELRDKTCFALAKKQRPPPALPLPDAPAPPPPPEPSPERIAQKTNCDNYITELQQFYTRYNEINNRDASAAVKKQAIIALYAEINGRRIQLYGGGAQANVNQQAAQANVNQQGNIAQANDNQQGNIAQPNVNPEIFGEPLAGGSLKNNKKRKTIKKNGGRGINITIKKR